MHGEPTPLLSCAGLCDLLPTRSCASVSQRSASIAATLTGVRLEDGTQVGSFEYDNTLGGWAVRWFELAPGVCREEVWDNDSAEWCSRVVMFEPGGEVEAFVASLPEDAALALAVRELGPMLDGRLRTFDAVVPGYLLEAAINNSSFTRLAAFDPAADACGGEFYVRVECDLRDRRIKDLVEAGCLALPDGVLSPGSAMHQKFLDLMAGFSPGERGPYELVKLAGERGLTEEQADTALRLLDGWGGSVDQLLNAAVPLSE
jgi:hypothetical protein